MVRLRTVRKRVQQGPTSPFSIHFSCTESQPSKVNGLRRHGLAPPNPACPARSDLLFAAKPQSPGREPGGPSSFLQSQSLSSTPLLFSEPKTSLKRKLLQKKNFPIPQLSIKALGRLKCWQTRKSLSLPFRTLGVGDAEEKAPTALLLHPPFFNAKNALPALSSYF
ncbi:hypothetical protein AVEN_199736-1 [Araneus ventricosus]|uniref:Uncharacterized protein n=1 Tax=Araneus ventricosus TaxID=182803 RepID=A0A4Y2LGL2_ARAVE|nr:hypothetical protein AVEN_199736-1 [Araneus ventricosus]